MLKNDTVRLLVFFKDFDGKAITPTEVKLTIYSTDETIKEEITDGIINISEGKYQYDYVATDSFIYEFSGFYNSLPILSRELCTVKFN